MAGRCNGDVAQAMSRAKSEETEIGIFCRRSQRHHGGHWTSWSIGHGVLNDFIFK